ncbi:hypothetical protein A2763_03295 [Candidatus Kaiserbacteria bacterium RIFCSPHIGHO2_01_FULL_54_36]|uniref:GH18 domain-containing protein n=1 Tax=Candidatus Kaiserbacteria bacterium RIFCSPHIGHO2_01_FULL_54_36 TaxID=1798482 RepID=A0A1F6CL07_9BACT|nr:MAG: hypothetical protein A2763_03295 [Candidatus Kaiserbacteria bacterium RIFCSPHIGHO2_01_FULL_54_36]OGG75424.1 MAG: hypothetical protein A3A41_02550 [Candidatus Kaiserbacteria bacterium RIFCSPLOWO2_01_FULL_54_22]
MKYVRLLLVTAAFLVPTLSFAQTSSCVTFTRNLSFGATGSEVTKLQTFLRAQGYFTAASVPRFGPATRTAVRNFQRANGISAVGTVGPITRAKIAILTCNPAAESFEVTGWIPYWRVATGTADTLPHLDLLTEVNPFIYTLRGDATLLFNGSTTDAAIWLSFNAQAKAKGVRVIPTLMSGDREVMHNVLSDQILRTTLIDQISTLVNEKGYDGIDIDFEFKHAKTKDYFSLFLKELKQRLGTKLLMCTIESRIPNEDRYYGTSVPQDAGIFSNDLPEINKYCDRVRIMAYDQQGIDRKLKAEVEATGELHAPVADPRWVEKVVNLMSKDIDKSKILIGVPTYGYEYSVTTYANNEHVYTILWPFNPGYALPIAEVRGITPVRNSAGEMYFTYFSDLPTSTPVSLVSGNLAAAAASQIATQQNSNLTYRLLDWPDAQSIQQKIDLAKRLGVRGISIFKFDGGQDPNIWSVLQGVKK